jgi:hypothetical protein
MRAHATVAELAMAVATSTAVAAVTAARPSMTQATAVAIPVWAMAEMVVATPASATAGETMAAVTPETVAAETVAAATAGETMAATAKSRIRGMERIQQSSAEPGIT